MFIKREYSFSTTQGIFEKFSLIHSLETIEVALSADDGDV